MAAIGFKFRWGEHYIAWLKGPYTTINMVDINSYFNVIEDSVWAKIRPD